MSGAVWDWNNQVGYVRFEAGKAASAAALREAIGERTMFTPGKVTFFYEEGALPDALR